MKIKKVLILATIIFSIMLLNMTQAYTISIDDVSADKDEEFVVTLNLDTVTILANGNITYDSSKIEFVGSDQENMQANVYDGSNENEKIVSWMYVDLTYTGTEQFEFTFKVLEEDETEMVFDDLAIIDVDKNEYEGEEISGNTTITINASNFNSKNVVVIIVAIVVVALLLMLAFKKKKAE